MTKVPRLRKTSKGFKRLKKTLEGFRKVWNRIKRMINTFTWYFTRKIPPYGACVCYSVQIYFVQNFLAILSGKYSYGGVCGPFRIIPLWDILSGKYPLRGVCMLFCTNTLYRGILSEKYHFQGRLWAISHEPFTGYFVRKIPLTGACVGGVCVCIIIQSTYNQNCNFYCSTAKIISIVRCVLW